jgi:hypothetical protein
LALDISPARYASRATVEALRNLARSQRLPYLIDRLPISDRLYALLWTHALLTLGQIAALTEKSFSDLPGFEPGGQASQEMHTFLASVGLEFAPPDSRQPPPGIRKSV